MKIDFSKINGETVPYFKGGKGKIELRIAEAKGGIKTIRAKLYPHSSVGLHAHTDDSETIYLLSGSAKAVCDGEIEYLSAGDATVCPKGYSHTLINDGDGFVEFFAVLPKY